MRWATSEEDVRAQRVASLCLVVLAVLSVVFVEYHNHHSPRPSVPTPRLTHHTRGRAPTTGTASPLVDRA